MKIVQVSHSDMPGERFSGYELTNALCKQDVDCSMLVKNKKSQSSYVHRLHSGKAAPFLGHFEAIGKEYQLYNYISPWNRMIVHNKLWKEADVVHYQFLRAFPISVVDLPMLFEGKKCVWTMHNFWPVTGGCLYPLTCQKYNQNCQECVRMDLGQPTEYIYSGEELERKRKSYQNADIEIVVSNFYMKKAIDKFHVFPSHKLHVIPFGLHDEEFGEDSGNRECVRKKYLIDEEKTVIGFRNDNSYIKGCQHIWNILRKKKLDNIVLMCVGGGSIPSDIKGKHKCIEFPWLGKEEMQQFYDACDIFLMPSLAETFGLMAIEAMARRCVVVCFKDTVLEEIVNAPDCGVAVNYRNDEEFGVAVEKLINSKMERAIRAQKSLEFVQENYKFELYVKKSLELYESILNRI